MSLEGDDDDIGSPQGGLDVAGDAAGDLEDSPRGGIRGAAANVNAQGGMLTLDDKDNEGRDEETLGEAGAATATPTRAEAPGKGPQAKSGWGDASSSSSAAASSSVSTVSALGVATAAGGADAGRAAKFGRRQAGGEAQKGKFDDDVVTDITEIPDIEEEAKEDLTNKVAEAPNVRSQKVQALTELDQAIQFTLPATPAGIDLSLLISALMPQEKVTEIDQPWDWEQLFQDAITELGGTEDEEKEEGEEDDEEKKQQIPTALGFTGAGSTPSFSAGNAAALAGAAAAGAMA